MNAQWSKDDVQRGIAAGLSALGVRRGGLLLVHASLSSLGWVPGGAPAVIEALRQTLGPEGTLLMPALTYEYVDHRQPVFDQARTPSCVGAISECFRTMPGVQRSLAPTHSVCGSGPWASWILGRHHLDNTPCGPRSPFRALRDLRGAILFLGCGLSPDTSVHGIEELVEPPYLFGGPVRYRMITGHGGRLDVTVRRHAFDGFIQRYDRVLEALPEHGWRSGRVGQALAYLLDARILWDRAGMMLRRDPYALVERG